MAKSKAARKGYFWGAADLWLLTVAPLVRTHDEAATIDRFFVSRHVKDLRVIVAVASFLLVLGTVVGVLLVAMEHWVAVHSVLLCLVGRGSWADLNIEWKTVNGETRSFLSFFAPALGVVGGIVAWAYKIASNRLGVVDLFACEIGTLSKVTTVVQAVDRQIDRFLGGPQPDPPSGSAHEHAEAFTSQENYFPVFESNARDLQALEADVVINITAFYTYMKAVRDTARKLARIAPPAARPAGPPPTPRTSGPWHDEAGNLLYMLFLGLESARLAIDDLVEFEPDNAERIVVVLLSELPAFQFLRQRFVEKDDSRHERIELRAADYRKIVPKLCRRIEKGREAPDKDEARRWKPAFLLLPELKRRYLTAVEELPAPGLPPIPVPDHQEHAQRLRQEVAPPPPPSSIGIMV